MLSVNAILILSIDDGSRIFAKYYTAPHQTTATPGAAGMLSTASELSLPLH
jgi:coatomer subunit zeta